MAQEVGVAYVTLLPSGRGFGKAVEGQVDDALGKSERKTNGFFSKIGTGIKRVGLGVAAIAGTVAGLAVTGGISRALNIEDAQAKLKGLGHDTQAIEAIMTNALAAVKGTAFGLDAAATTAAAAVASGIKPGQELERYLRLTADAATIAGVSMEEMGSIVNKVQAKGKAQMEDLNRLTERGIPIMQMLADEYGVTADEMSDMVSRGEVDSERFRRALEKNVGGAALASGDTTRGAFANMRAALSRLGLVFVEDALGGAKTFFNEVTIILDGLAERFKPWVDGIKERLSGMFNLDGMGERFLAGFDRITAAIANGPIPKFLDALAPIVPAVADLAFVVGGVLGDALKELGKALAPVLPEVAEALANAVVELAPSLTDLLVALVPLIPPLVELLAAVTPLVVSLVEGLIPAIEWLVEQMTPLIGTFSAFANFVSGDSSFDEYGAKLEKLGGIVGAAFGWMNDYNTLFTEFGAGLSSAVTEFTNWVSGMLTSISMFFGEAAAAVQATWQLIVFTVSSSISSVSSIVTGVLGGLRDWWNSVWSEVSSTVVGTWTVITATVQNGVNSAVAWIQPLPGRVQAALSDAGSWLVETGKNIIRGLIQGVSSMIGDAIASVQSVGAEMVAGVQSVLGIHSPSRVFRDEVGKMVGLGLLEGIEDRAVAGRIDTAVNHLVEVPSLAGAGGGGASYVQNNSFEHLDPQVAIELSDRRFDSFVRGAL